MLDEEILVEFVTESKGLLAELTSVVEMIETASEDPGAPFPEELLREFAQKIDRIMGAAQTMDMMDEGNPVLAAIGRLAQGCKTIGYQAAEKKKTALLPFFAAFWVETIEVVGELLDHANSSDEVGEILKSFSPVLEKRLVWLQSKINGT